MSETITDGGQNAETRQDDAPHELTLGEIIRRASEGQTAEQITGEAPPEGERTRAENGRFTSTRADGGTEEQDDADKPTTTAEEPEAPAITPPQAWSATEKDVFTSLPRQAQEAILRREKDVERAFQDRAKPLKEYEAIQEVLAPFASNYRTQGYTDVDAVRMWATVAGELRRDPANAIRQLIQSHGLTPEQIVGRTANPQQTSAHPPASAEVQELRREIAAFKEGQEREAQSRIVSRIESFARDPKNEYFNEVRKYMGALMVAEPELSMEDAYDRAIYANPDVRAKLEAKQEAAKEAKRLAEAKSKAESARRAAAPVRGAPPIGAGGAAATGERTLRQEIEAAMAAHSQPYW